MIVFCNQKKTADMVAKDIQKAGFSATTLHSGKNQEQREEALQSLRDGRHDILVATDLVRLLRGVHPFVKGRTRLTIARLPLLLRLAVVSMSPTFRSSSTGR
jgi:superfamily II DNA/RNA helicase